MAATTIFLGSSSAARAQARAILRRFSSPKLRFLPWWDAFTAGRTLLKDLDHVRGRVVWDLLPREHEAAWPVSDAPARRIGVRFLDERGRGRQRTLTTVSHWNKLLKGALVRHVVTTQLTDPAGLVEFRHPEGYDYRPELSVVEGNREVVSLVRTH